MKNSNSSNNNNNNKNNNNLQYKISVYLPEADTIKLFQNLFGKCHLIFTIKDMILIIRSYYWYKPPTQVRFAYGDDYYNSKTDDYSSEPSEIIDITTVICCSSHRFPLGRCGEIITSKVEYHFKYGKLWGDFPSSLTDQHIGRIGRFENKNGFSMPFLIIDCHPSGQVCSVIFLEDFYADHKTKTLYVKRFGRDVDSENYKVNILKLNGYRCKLKMYAEVKYVDGEEIETKRYKVRSKKELESETDFSIGLSLDFLLTEEEYKNFDDRWLSNNALFAIYLEI